MPDHEVRGVGREFHALGLVKRVDGLDEADVALLGQVLDVLGGTRVLASYALDEIRVMLHHRFLKGGVLRLFALPQDLLHLVIA